MQVLVKKDIGKLWNNVFKYKRINKDELINYDVPQNVLHKNAGGNVGVKY